MGGWLLVCGISAWEAGLLVDDLHILPLEMLVYWWTSVCLVVCVCVTTPFVFLILQKQNVLLIK